MEKMKGMKLNNIIFAAMTAAAVTAFSGAAVMAAEAVSVDNVITADNMTLNKTETGTPRYNQNKTFTVADDYMSTYNNGVYNKIFGELNTNGTLTYTSDNNYISASNGYLTADFTVNETQNYDVYFLTGRAWGSTRYSITSQDGSKTFADGATLSFNKLAMNANGNADALNAAKGNTSVKLDSGTYTVKYYGANNASDFIALKFVPEKTFMKTVNDVFTASEMSTMGNSSGNPTTGDFSMTASDSYGYAADYVKLFGENGSKLGSKSFGWLGKRGTCGFRFNAPDAGKTYKLYVAGIYDRPIKAAVKNEDGEVVAEGTMTKSSVMGYSGGNTSAPVIGYTLDNITLDKAGIYSVTIDSEAGADQNAPDVVAAAFLDKSEPMVLLDKSSYKLDAYNLREVTLKAEVSGSEKVSWTSSNPNAAKVDDNGVVTAVAKGETIITASAGDTSAGCKVTVTDSAKPDAENVENLSVKNTAAQLYVGEGKEYSSLRAAVKAAEELNPSSEESRVVINVDPGTYREQVVVSKPYITIRKTPGTDGVVNLTWYYGCGQFYKSSNAKNQYEEGNTEPHGVTRWGATLQVNGSAHDFVVENIRLENSFNLYYTDEELNDLAGKDTDQTFDRGVMLRWLVSQGYSRDYINEWIQSRTAIKEMGVSGSDYDNAENSFRERAAAFYCDADRSQIRGCTIVSKQDTIGINGGRMYFDRCTLEGTVDYVCGSAAPVINNCIMRAGSGPALDAAQTGSDGATYLCPANDLSTGGRGYLVYNSTFTGNAWTGRNNIARPWNKNGETILINAKVDYSEREPGSVVFGDGGWADMSGAKAETAYFGEYNTMDIYGNPIDTSKRNAAGVGVLSEQGEYTMYNFTKGNDEWDPSGTKPASAPVYTNKVLQSFTGDDNSTATVVQSTVNGNINYIKWTSKQAAAGIDDKSEMTGTYEGQLSGDMDYVFGVIVPNVLWTSDADSDLEVSFEK